MSSQDRQTTGTTRTALAEPTQEVARSVNVTIRGKRLALRSRHNPEFVHELAGYLDGQVSALQKAAPTAPFEKLLMLASLQIVEELFTARAELTALTEALDAQIETIQELLLDHSEELDELDELDEHAHTHGDTDADADSHDVL